MRRALASFIALLSLPASASAAPLKVACIGDSITQISGWCECLGTRLGQTHTVKNFGVSSTTLMKAGDSPYWNCPQFAPSHDFAPDMAIIMLGTNDSKSYNWSHKADFVSDYAALIDTYSSLASKPRIFVALPPPAGKNSYGISGAVLENEELPLMRRVAKDARADVIDVFTAFGGGHFDAGLFPSEDQVHPNVQGAQLICDTVYAALTARVEAPKAGAMSTLVAGVPSFATGMDTAGAASGVGGMQPALMISDAGSTTVAVAMQPAGTLSTRTNGSGCQLSGGSSTEGGSTAALFGIAVLVLRIRRKNL